MHSLAVLTVFPVPTVECEEYGELTKEKVFVNPLALGSSSQQALSYSTCDSTTPLIVGGEKTKNNEFPHMAAIGWRSIDGTLSFKCGGSLISDRFVLTAAHCSRADGSAPSIVRLGDQNLKSRQDGLIEVDVPVAEFIKHENFRRSSYYEDIAVIKLSRAVEYVEVLHFDNHTKQRSLQVFENYTTSMLMASIGYCKFEINSNGMGLHRGCRSNVRRTDEG